MQSISNYQSQHMASDVCTGYSLAHCVWLCCVQQDNICTAGLRTTAGSKVLDSYLPPFDATIVARLRAAGAVLIGKTNMDEFGMGSTTENSAYKVRYDHTHLPNSTQQGNQQQRQQEPHRRQQHCQQQPGMHKHALGAWAHSEAAAANNLASRPRQQCDTCSMYQRHYIQHVCVDCMSAHLLPVGWSYLCCLGHQQPLGHQQGPRRLLWGFSSSSSSTPVCSSHRQRHRRQHQAAGTLLWCGGPQTQLWACVTLWADCVCILTGCHWASDTQCGGCCTAAGGHRGT